MNSFKTVLFILILLIGCFTESNTRSYLKVNQLQQNSNDQINTNQNIDEGQNQTLEIIKTEKQNQWYSRTHKIFQNDIQNNQQQSAGLSEGQNKQNEPVSQQKSQPESKPQTQLSNNAQNLFLFSPRNIELKKDQIINYNYKFEDIGLQGDLYFIGFSRDQKPEQSPNVKVKLNNTELNCIKKATDVVCLIQKQDFKANDIFNVQVTCTNYCEITIQVYMNSQINLQMGNYTQIQFHMDAAGVIVNSKLPQYVKQFTQVNIIATIDNSYEIKDGFKMKAAVGPELNTSNVQFKYESTSVWDDGQGIFLTKDQINTGDSIKIIIVGPKFLKLTLNIFYKNNDTRTIYLDEDVYDDAKNTTKYYQIDISGQQNIDTSGLYFKLIRYSGISQLTIFTDNTKSKQITFGSDQTTNNHFVLSPEQRKSQNLSDKFTLSVSSTGVATYKLLVELDSKGYTQIQNGQAQFGIIEKNQVDNFIFQVQHIPSVNNNKTITLSVKALQGNVSILVTRCGSLEVNNTYDCIYNTTQQVKNSDKFNEIIGTYHQYPEEKTFHFTFNYDTSLCPNKQGLKTVHNCVFLFVLQSQQQRSRYELVIGQISQDYKILQQGIPMRDRLFQLNYNYYRLTLSNNDNIIGANFFLSTISGDAVILGSTTVKFPQLPKDSRFDQPQVKSHAYFIDFNQSSDTYYISVFAYDTSYYALTASIVRKDSNNKTIVSQLTLLQNIPSINFIDENDQELKFYIYQFVGTSFFIDIQQIVGYTWFRVKRADDNWQVIAEEEFQQSDNWIEITQKEPTKPTNYIVIVQSSQGVFSIQYSKKGGCIVHRFSKPVFIMLDVNTTRCYSYEITVIDNIDISTSIGNYQGGINNVNITIDINGTTFQLNESSMSIPSTKWIEYCPNLALQDNKNITTCFMKVYAQSYIDIYYNFVVQYENQQIYLVDGVYQRTNTQLSKQIPKHYYFIVDWENTITVFLKSFTNSNYQINARIVSWRQYLTMTQQSVYPLFDFNNDISSNTSSLQTTSLIITRATLDKYQCNYNCVLLISVFTTDQSLTKVSYDIQVSQLRGYLFSGDAKLGFVEAGNSQIYQIKTSLISQDAQLLLKVQPLTEDCAITTLSYRLEAKDQFQEQGLELTNNSYIIPAHQEDRVYSVQINTKTTCAFQISLLSSDSFVILIPGISFDVNLNPQLPQYYLYRHKFNESINILTMTQYGNINIEATPLTQQQQTNISKLVQFGNIEFKFQQSSNVGYLQIQTSDKDFCVHCYYLIKLTSIDNSSVDLVVFPSGTPIQVRANRIINEKIHIGQDKKIYRYNSQKSFYINLDLSIGQASLKVIRLRDKKVIINYNVSGSEVITVYANSSLEQLKNNEKSGWDLFGEVYLYQIVIAPISNNSAVAYSLVFKNSTDPLRLRQGIPFTINVRDKNKCVTFPSLASNKSAYLIISMQDTNKLAYILNCSQTVNNKTSDCARGSNLLIKQVRTPQSISSQIRQFSGTYSFCVTMMKLTSFTILLSRNNMIHLQPDKPLFIESTTDIQTFDIYNPNLQNVMIQVYECKGKVALLTTSNYSQLQNSRNADSKVVLQRSKIAGHFVSNYEPYQGDEILDLFTSVIPQNNSLASYVIKYTHYNKDNPYQSIEPDSLDVRYDLTEDEIIFKVDRIVNYGGYQSIQNNNYTILISSDASSLLNIANCQVNKADIQASYVLDSNPQGNSNVEFAIPLQNFENIYGQNHFYATAIAVVGSSGFSRSKHRHSYKIIYNIAQINLNYRANMDKSGVELKILFVWVVLPTIIVLIIIFIALRHCIKGMRYNPIEDAVHLVQQNPNMSLDTRKNDDGIYPTTQTVLVAPKSLSQVEQNNENSSAQSDLRQ